MNTRSKISLFIVILLGLSACGSTKLLTQSKNLTEEVKAQFAPDGRTSIYKIEPVVQNKVVTLSGETNIPEAKEHLLESFRKAQIRVKDDIKLLPDSDLSKPFGVVTLSVANLRSKPAVSSGLETQALMGMPLKIYKKKGHWYFVQTPEKYIKWMNGGAFAQMSKEAFEAWKKTPKVIFIDRLGYAYKEPDAKSQIVTDLIAGNILKKINFDGDFTLVALPDGTEAFVLTEKLQNYDDWLDTRKLNADNIEKAAYGYLGAPYVWGGTSGKGLDCSGFTKNVMLQNGIMFPRDASQQIKVGKEIPLDEKLSQVQKGDLLFFGRKGTSQKKERITHVGIYLGNGKFIHAGVDKAKVAIESLFPEDDSFAPNRLKSLLHAKRIIGYEGTLGVEPVSKSMYND